jgi:hypothetical protein
MSYRTHKGPTSIVKIIVKIIEVSVSVVNEKNDTNLQQNGCLAQQMSLNKNMFVELE